MVVVDARKCKTSAARISGTARAMANELGATRVLRFTMPTDETSHLVWFDGGTTRGQPARPIAPEKRAAEENLRSPSRHRWAPDKLTRSRAAALSPDGRALRSPHQSHFS